MKLTKKGCVRGLFFLYLLIVIRLIIFKYPAEELRLLAADWSEKVVLEGMKTANFKPFKTIRMYIDYAYKLNSVENLAGNILIFVPFGVGFPLVMEKGRNFGVMLFHTFVFVLGIEGFQLLTGFGAFDVDDILLNCLGAVLGYVLFLAGRGFVKKKVRAEKRWGTGVIRKKG